MNLNKLGIFYTHSHNFKNKKHNRSIFKLHKKASNSQADILTSVWDKIKIIHSLNMYHGQSS